MKSKLFLLLYFCVLYISGCGITTDYNAADGMGEKESEEAIESKVEQEEKREIIIMGKYGDEDVEWLVLSQKEGMTLLISRYILDYKCFNDSTVAEPTDWENSSIRAWLNGDFFENTFSNDEKDAIQVATVQDFKADHVAGNWTEDRVFLLTVDEAWTYFETDALRATIATEYAKQMKKFPQDSWWLIDSYCNDLYKYLVGIDGSNQNNPRVNEAQGVRPAIWVVSDYIK